MKLGSIPSKSLFFRHYSSSKVQSLRRAFTVLITNFQSSTFSTSVGNSSSRHPQYDDESRAVRVSVWWDFKNCNLPVGANVFKVAQTITGAIRNSGIKGPITITAFGDVLQLSKTNQDALSATGISLTHVPQGGKNSTDRSLITDLMGWVSQNPPPAHIFLISSDKDFASVLHKLRMSNYNILLASKTSAPGVLCSAATIMWDWNPLIKGVNVSGKHFNQPPDGPYNSWYGHYKIPLLDPFATTEHSCSVKTEELSESGSISDSSTNAKVRPIPKELVKKIRLILSLYPKGASITELRAELSKSNLAIDKNFYGHKKFSRFLLSMPDVVEVNSAGGGLYIIRAVTQVTPTRFDSGSGLSLTSDQGVKEKETDYVSSAKENSDVEVASVAAERRRDDSLGKNTTDNSKCVKEESQETEETSPEPFLVSQKDVKATEEPLKMNQVVITAGNDSSTEDGLFQKLKRLWFGSPKMESEHLLENTDVSGNEDKGKIIVSNGNAEDNDLKSSNQRADLISQISPSFTGESAEEKKAGIEECNGKYANPGYLRRILKSFKIWGKNTGLSNDHSRNQELVDAQVHDIFANDTFWSDVESFINSPRGFAIVCHSKTREMMAKNLQKEGPASLRLLNESSMLNLVTVLISEKKWIEENPSQSLPFCIPQFTEIHSSSSHRHAANGLSSIFLDFSNSLSQKQNGEKRSKNVAHTGISVVSMDQKQVERYKSKAIADCQKLLKKITEEKPEGYNMTCFKKDFLEEFGYHLEVEKLGYERLQSLLQLMSGVRITSGYIFPVTSSPEAKEDDSDSSFEELGPVSDADQMTKTPPVYESSLSEVEDSGSERENNSIEKKDEQTRKKKQDKNGEDKNSSLLQLLDVWYNNQEEDAKKETKSEERKLVNVTLSNGKKQKL